MGRGMKTERVQPIALCSAPRKKQSSQVPRNEKKSKELEKEFSQLEQSLVGKRVQRQGKERATRPLLSLVLF